MIQVAMKLAEIKNLPLHEIASITTNNAEKLFGLGNS
jgi:Tat protein secretion system quality control protein TatD with DNase activity